MRISRFLCGLMLVGVLTPWAGAQTCNQVTINFDTEDDFSTPLVDGQDISTPPEFGRLLSISGTGNNQGPAIFDTTIGGSNDPGADPDLLVDLGNSLILQSNDDPEQTVPGIYDTPNDSARGGTLDFEYLVRAQLFAIDLIDICPGNAATVTMTDDEGRIRFYDVPTGWTTDINLDGPPGFGTLDLTTLDPQPGFKATATATEDPGFDPTTVVSLSVFFTGSGAVDNLVFCEYCPEENVSIDPDESEGEIGTLFELTVTVTDAGGDPIPGREVNFELLPGSANFPESGTETTDANGEATFSYVGENLGTDTIDVEVEANTCGATGGSTITRDWICPPEEIVLTPATSEGEIGETHTVFATLTRTDTGDPLVGVEVFFETTAGSANDASGSATTDGGGIAAFVYVGENPGTDTIEATFVGCDEGVVKSNRVEREWVCPVETLTLSPLTSSGPIGSEHTVTALLLDADSNPIEGRLVTFMTIGGSANSASGSDTTDANGMASFSYIGENLGTDFILATVDDCAGDDVKSNTVEREWECPPEAITLTPQTSEGPIGTEHTVTATLTRTDTGDPLEGRIVDFMTLPGSANDASGQATSDANGIATFSYIGENTGLDMIQASFSDCSMTVVQSNVVERVWTCPVETVTLAPESSEGPVGTKHTVTATVLDEDLNPVQGREVMFETLDGSANDAMGTSMTDANGMASFTYLGENEGLDTIRVTIDDCLGDKVVSNVVEREWTCPGEMLTLTSDPPMPTVGMEVKVVAIVTTLEGDPVEGRLVTFEFLPGSVSTGGATIETNSSGKAKFIYTQGDVGTDYILATAEDCAGNEIDNEIEVIWAECFLWIGKKKDDTPLSPPDQDIQLVKKIKVNLPVLENDIPMIRIPNRPSLLGRHVYAQVYLSNPTIFPEDPIQTSNGLDITLGVDELPVPYGPDFGIDLWADTPALLGQDWTILFDVRNL